MNAWWSVRSSSARRRNSGRILLTSASTSVDDPAAVTLRIVWFNVENCSGGR
jgi:hypothetical protein